MSWRSLLLILNTCSLLLLTHIDFVLSPFSLTYIAFITKPFHLSSMSLKFRARKQISSEKFKSSSLWVNPHYISFCHFFFLYCSPSGIPISVSSYSSMIFQIRIQLAKKYLISQDIKTVQLIRATNYYDEVLDSNFGKIIRIFRTFSGFLLARQQVNLDMSWWHRHISWKLSWSRSMAPWTTGSNFIPSVPSFLTSLSRCIATDVIWGVRYPIWCNDRSHNLHQTVSQLRQSVVFLSCKVNTRRSVDCAHLPVSSHYHP